MSLIAVASGPHQTIVGTAGDDVINVNFESSIATVNGNPTDFSAASVVQIDGLGGRDLVVLVGDDAVTESVFMNGRTIRLQDGNRFVRAFNSERLVFRGGENDNAVLLDSVGDDTVIMSNTVTQLSSPGNAFVYAVSGVSRINITANRGGQDVANVQAPAIERVIADENFVRLLPGTQSNYPTTHVLLGFENINTRFAKTFVLEDTPGDDLLTASRRSMLWSTSDTELRHTGSYERIDALSQPLNESGFDVALLTMERVDDTEVVYSKPTLRSDERNLTFTDVEKRILVQGFSDNEIEMINGPSTEPARVVFNAIEIRPDPVGVMEGSLEDKTFDYFGSQNVSMKGFEDFICIVPPGSLFNATIDGSEGDDRLLRILQTGMQYFAFESDDCIFQGPTSRGMTFNAEQGGIDRSTFVGSQFGIVNGEDELFDAGFENVVSIETTRVEIYAPDNQNYRIFATPDSLTFTGPSGFRRTFIDYEQARVFPLARGTVSPPTTGYGPGRLRVVYDAENDPTFRTGSSSREVGTGFIMDGPIAVQAFRDFITDSSTLSVMTGDFLSGFDVPGAEDIPILNQ